MQLFIGVIHNRNPKDRQIIKTIRQTIQITTGQETQTGTSRKPGRRSKTMTQETSENVQNSCMKLTRLCNERVKTQGLNW